MKLWECTKCDNMVITGNHCRYVRCYGEHMAIKDMEMIKQSNNLIVLLKEVRSY